MRIDSIYSILNSNCYNINKNKQNQTSTYKNSTNPLDIFKNFPVPFLGTPRVRKDMARFFNVNEEKIPTSVKLYLETLQDMFTINPVQAHKNAYANLINANNIEDVQKIFPEEELFIYLKPLENTKATKGLLNIYREFKELFQNGILSNGDDFVVYLLRKLFMEAKSIPETNSDLDKDLIPDIKDLFYSRHKHNDYLQSSTLKGLGIYLPDSDYLTSLRYTRDGYSDYIGLKISEALQRKWDAYSDEEKENIIRTRCKGRDEWWNNLPYEKKLELAAGVESEDDLYKDFKKYVKDNNSTTKKETDSYPEYETAAPKKRIKVGSNIKDKDLFILWMKKNLEKYYASLSEKELEVINLKRSKMQTLRWEKMTPEERTDYINKIRTGLEPLKYAMIDAWNHSRLLIRALADYLQEQQVLRPIDLIYSDSAFKEFQSKIMTEFWAQNKEMADDFGKKLKYSHQKVEEAMLAGKFEELKKEIENERVERINLLAKDYQTEAEEAEKIEEEKIKEKEALIPQEALINRKEFAEVYKNYIDRYNILPEAYTKEMAELIFDRLPEDMMTQYANAIKNNKQIPQNILDELKKSSMREERLNRTLETAIAAEMTTKGYGSAIYEMDLESMLPLLTNKYLNDASSKGTIDTKRIERLFNEYNRDLDGVSLSLLADKYFAPVVQNQSLTREQNDEFEEYLNTYGRSLLILFSEKSAFSDDIKIHYNNKFLKLMPAKIKEYVNPYIKTSEDIAEENEINKMTANIYKRFKYIPDNILKFYTRELGYGIRIDRETHEQNWLKLFTNMFTVKAADNAGQAFPNIVKNLLANDEKLQFIAIEQAMADEFYRVTKDNESYTKSFEQLLSFFDMLSVMKKNAKLELNSQDGSITFAINEKPNYKSIYTRYIKYFNALKQNKNLIDTDKNIVIPELLYSLNPDAKYSFKNRYIIKRIQPYFMTNQEYMEKDASPLDDLYRTNFIQVLKKSNKYSLIPPNYISDFANILLDRFPKDFIENYTYALSKKSKIPEDILKTLADEGSKNNNPQLARIQRALEAAISTELVNKGGTPFFFEMTSDTLIPVYKERALNSRFKKLDIKMVQTLYNEFQKDLTPDELERIINGYFASKDPSPENDKILEDYINEYGRSALILFSNDNNYSYSIKNAFNQKFLKLMPQKLKDTAIPLLRTADDIVEDIKTNSIRRQIAKRFSFIPSRALNTYTQEVATAIRLFRLPESSPEDRENYSLDNIQKHLCNKHINSDDGISIRRIPKYITSNNAKLKLLAIEQAMADELFRISGCGEIYKYEFEDLATWLEMALGLKKSTQKLEISNDAGLSFEVKLKPNERNLLVKYSQYLSEINGSEDLYLKNGEINREELLYCLNFDDDKPHKDELVKERINKYFIN